MANLWFLGLDLTGYKTFGLDSRISLKELDSCLHRLVFNKGTVAKKQVALYLSPSVPKKVPQLLI